MVQALVQSTARVSRHPIIIILGVFIPQAVLRPHLGVPTHPQLHDVPLELVRVRSPRLAHKKAGAGFEGQGPGLPLQHGPLCRPAVQVERGHAALHAQRQARPASGQRG